MTIQTEQVMSTDDFVDAYLEHYGVKGMKWGVHKKPSSADIHTARDNVNSQAAKIRKTKRTIKEQKKAGKSTAGAENRLAKQKVELLNNPDRITASRLTKGESIAVGILSAAGGPVGIAAVGTRLAINSAARKTVAKRQASGYYDKKK